MGINVGMFGGMFGGGPLEGWRWSGAMDDATSLDRFGTVAFGPGLMNVNATCFDDEGRTRRLFSIVPSHGAISLDYWFTFVPEIYRAAVTAEVQRIFPRFNKTKLTPQQLAIFVADLQRSIWDNVEPVR